ncbi:MAG: DUF3280 domain-containing protein [Janthinobacterium lividum]
MNSQPSSSRPAARGAAFAAALVVAACAPALARAQAGDAAPSAGAAGEAAAPKPPSGDYEALAGAVQKTAAFFPFSMDDTSLQGSEEGLSQAERDRLGKLDAILEQMLVATGKFTPVDTSKVAPDELAAVKAASTHLKVWDCNGCDVDEAKKLGAQVSVAAWVQKVSRLILNVNVTIRDVASNRLLYGGSVDIRGDTDESWTRGLRYLIKDRMFQGPHTAGGTGTAAR